ncbi:hypothetical protein C2S51_038397 [Perilla frutescens var. frutescens]|nr:hypothetical protein C2S51_038397 [Perilla frutescens var. frutescens]
MATSWTAKPSVSYHMNGWFVLRFKNMNNMVEIYERGPYNIFRRPILMYLMQEDFSFTKALSKQIRTWVNLVNLPMEFWNPKALGKVASCISKPIMTDSATYSKKRMDIARVLIEIDAKSHLYRTWIHRHQMVHGAKDEHQAKNSLGPWLTMKAELSKAMDSAKCKHITLPFDLKSINSFTLREGQEWMETSLIKMMLLLPMSSTTILEELQTILEENGYTPDDYRKPVNSHIRFDGAEAEKVESSGSKLERLAELERMPRVDKPSANFIYMTKQKARDLNLTVGNITVTTPKGIFTIIPANSQQENHRSNEAQPSDATCCLLGL